MILHVRVRTLVWLTTFVAGCASAKHLGDPTPDGPPLAARCDGALPGWATGVQGELVARCPGIEVHATPLADGVIHLRYAATGAVERPSWAVLATHADSTALIGGNGAAAAVCTDSVSITIDAACMVHAQLADGTPLLDDAAAFDGAGTLVRTARTDRVYGLGERTGGLDRRGHVWTFWNTDAYDPAFGGWKPGQDPMYQAIPFELHLGAGGAFGLFTDETRQMTIELGGALDTTKASSPSLSQYVIAGPILADVVRRYTALTGAPAMPPRWAFGFHQSRWGYTGATDLLAIADRFRSEGIPADALWLDIQSQNGFRSFTFDEASFPPSLIGQLAAKGFHVVAIEDPGIKVETGYSVYDSGVAGGHFLAKNGSVYQGTAWPGAAAWPDLSRPETRAWWGQQIAHVADRGIAGIWLDVNEPTTFPEGGGGTTVPDELPVFGDGTAATMAELHNAYALFEARATFDALAERGTRPFVLSRAGYAGIQRYAAVWTGDVPSTWSGLDQTLPMLLGLGMSGVPFVGSDIGGYSGNASPELYARWLSLGSISPFARAHVTNGVPGQEPWMFGADVTALARARLGDRYRVMPYLYSLGAEAVRSGAPILRPLVWEFPDDPMVADLGDEAMLGPSILVAPITGQGAMSRTVYLPAGRWFELHSGKIIDGPATITATISLSALPLYVRAGAIIPTDDAGTLGFEVYPSATPSTFTLYEDDGSQRTAGALTTITVTPNAAGATVAIDHDGAAPVRTIHVRVHRVDGAVSGVDGAQSFTVDPDDRSITAIAADAMHAALAFHYDPTITELAPPVNVTFEIHVPADTAQTSPISIVSSVDNWTAQTALAWVSAGIARGTVALPRGDWFEYKVTRGTWATVEKLANCSEVENRSRQAAAGAQIDTVATWRDRCGN